MPIHVWTSDIMNGFLATDELLESRLAVHFCRKSLPQRKQKPTRKKSRCSVYIQNIQNFPAFQAKLVTQKLSMPIHKIIFLTGQGEFHSLSSPGGFRRRQAFHRELRWFYWWLQPCWSLLCRKPSQAGWVGRKQWENNTTQLFWGYIYK